MQNSQEIKGFIALPWTLGIYLILSFKFSIKNVTIGCSNMEQSWTALLLYCIHVISVLQQLGEKVGFIQFNSFKKNITQPNSLFLNHSPKIFHVAIWQWVGRGCRDATSPAKWSPSLRIRRWVFKMTWRYYDI